MYGSIWLFEQLPVQVQHGGIPCSVNPFRITID